MKSEAGRDFRKAYKNAGVPLDRKKFRGIFKRITHALRTAQRLAESNLSNRRDIHTKQYRSNQIDIYTETGETDKIKELLNPPHGK